MSHCIRPTNSPDPVFFPSRESGQGLIEYLIIVALIAVATIGIMSVMGQAVGSRFATISDALQGKKKTYRVEQIDDSLTRKKDLGDFMNGVATEGGGSR